MKTPDPSVARSIADRLREEVRIISGTLELDRDLRDRDLPTLDPVERYSFMHRLWDARDELAIAESHSDPSQTVKGLSRD